MDYHAVHGYDIASFNAPGTHRLPTVSASQALDDIGGNAPTHISTGIEGLDHALLGTVPVESQDTALKGGVRRGQVTEIWGPPGTGKTALGLQLAAHALRDGDAVVWIASKLYNMTDFEQPPRR
ncbi:Ff.00g029870.m01.CDS01 [Fusarium sp. VM40]|nr:Ff.00g029870.m01.CDS01 [Fusarium sp. VM40]